MPAPPISQTPRGPRIIHYTFLDLTLPECPSAAEGPEKPAAGKDAGHRTPVATVGWVTMESLACQIQLCMKPPAPFHSHLTSPRSLHPALITLCLGGVVFLISLASSQREEKWVIIWPCFEIQQELPVPCPSSRPSPAAWGAADSFSAPKELFAYSAVLGHNSSGLLITR